MNELRTYLGELSVNDQAAFARRVGTSIGYLRKAMSVGQTLGEKLCNLIERESGGAVSRKCLRPNDWQDIWPDLVQVDTAQGV